MATDFSKPLLTDSYASIVPGINQAYLDIIRWLEPTLTGANTNIPTGAIRLNASTWTLERYSGTAWAALQLKIGSGTADTGTFTTLSGSTITGSVSVSAPIYYDSNNTAYFIDAASTSVLNAVTAQTFYANAAITTSITATNLNSLAATSIYALYADPGTVAAGDGKAIALGMVNRGRSYIASIHPSTSKDATALTFWITNGAVTAEALRLDSYGNLGLNTTSPNYGGYTNGANTVLTIAGKTTYGALELANVGALSDGKTLGQLNFVNPSQGNADKSSAIITSRQRGTDVTNPGSDLAFYTRTNAGSLVERLTLDAIGNAGLGVTPSTWVTGKAIQVGTTGTALWGYADTTYLTQNAAGYPSTSFLYGTTAAAAGYRMQSGAHAWFVAPSGTAGAAITFTQAMTLDVNGILGLGITTPSTWSQGKAIEIGAIGNALWGNTIADLRFFSNAYYNTGYKYANSNNPSTMYQQTSGAHTWYSAAAGTAGAAITWTQLMSLDINGNQVVRGSGQFGSSATSYNIIVNGISSGLAGGSSIGTQLSGVPTISIGNYSNIVGGTYDATPTIFGSTALRFYLSSAAATLMTLESSGSLGLGVTISAWQTGTQAFQIGNGALWKSGSRAVDFMTNMYYNGTNYIYNTSNAATTYRQVDGQHIWYSAPAGTAAAAATVTQLLVLDIPGNLGLVNAPSAWDSTRKAVEGPAGALLNTSTTSLSLYFNMYHNGTNYITKNAGSASYLTQSATGLSYGFFTATTAGTATASIGAVFSIQTNGNVSFGGTGAAWGGTYRGLGIVANTNSVYGNSSNLIGITNNSYNNGTNFLYSTTNAATTYEQSGGVHSWKVAASGTAGATITWTTALSLDGNRNLTLYGAGTAGVSTGLTVQNGDITTYRSGGTTGVIYLSNSGGNYLYWDGTNYNLGANVALHSGNWSSYVSGGATGAGTDKIFWENGQTVTTNYSITSGKNAMTAGPVTINTGVTVTVPSGSTWTIV